jgi:hypothetical protein
MTKQPNEKDERNDWFERCYRYYKEIGPPIAALKGRLAFFSVRIPSNVVDRWLDEQKERDADQVLRAMGEVEDEA